MNRHIIELETEKSSLLIVIEQLNQKVIDIEKEEKNIINEIANVNQTIIKNKGLPIGLNNIKLILLYNEEKKKHFTDMIKVSTQRIMCLEKRIQREKKYSFKTTEEFLTDYDMRYYNTKNQEELSDSYLESQGFQKKIKKQKKNLKK